MSQEPDDHVIELLPAYVLDALTDEETGQVAQHLAGCKTCQEELSRLQLVADDLPLALVQTAPPPRVKQEFNEGGPLKAVESSTPNRTDHMAKMGGFLPHTASCTRFGSHRSSGNW